MRINRSVLLNAKNKDNGTNTITPSRKTMTQISSDPHMLLTL